ncbi:hypothetical protein EYC84_008098 [Monilinia fructicola]|uniref:Uncharacterized protein n=1 Tax=Monilinia fructicola TaxID=38448 RepID=A0A5M9JE38_MONFR|nr:hypothetical protein EYC84_008098 [Monilinia fructicola]
MDYELQKAIWDTGKPCNKIAKVCGQHLIQLFIPVCWKDDIINKRPVKKAVPPGLVFTDGLIDDHTMPLYDYMAYRGVLNYTLRALKLL